METAKVADNVRPTRSRLGAEMAEMSATYAPLARGAARLLREPIFVFFAIGGLVFLAHRAIAGDPRTIVVSSAVRSDLDRRFRDQLGRAPNAGEIDVAMKNWERDESLFREALRDGVEREDPAVRALLIDKVRERLGREFPVPEPSQGDLDQWLLEHRKLYEMPFVYEFEYIAFPNSDPQAEQRRQKFEPALRAGATPNSLGLRTVAANVRRERIEEELGSDAATRIVGLPVGQWHTLENQNNRLLVRMIHIEGGLPKPEELRERLSLDWKSTRQQQAIERAAQSIADHYRFVEKMR